MSHHRFLISILFLLPVYYCYDQILLTTIQIHSDVGVISCGSSLNLTIDSVKGTPICDNLNQEVKNSVVLLTYNSTSFDGFKNVSFLLLATLSHVGNGTQEETNNYTGVYLFDEKSIANEISLATLTLKKLSSPPTKASLTEEENEGRIEQLADITSTEVHLTMNYVHLKYDDTPKKVVENNGGAVAVAIIEGIALIAILAYMGYRTMVKHRMKETTMNSAMYGYDNNSRNSIRMSDIPPPRDPTYASPPSSQQPTPTRNTVMTTQELVVPTSTAAQTRPTTTTTEQFRDPFDTLENW